MAYDETKPGDDDDIFVSAGNIRSNFDAIKNNGDDFDMVAVPLLVQGSNPSGVTNTGHLYAKADATSGQVELFYQNDNSEQIQITDGTSLKQVQTGTWTPDISGTGTVTQSVQAGRYTKIGNVVHAIGTIVYTGGNTAFKDAAFNISGLPFTIANNTNEPAVAYGNVDSGSLGIVSPLQGIAAINTTVIGPCVWYNSLAFASGFEDFTNFGKDTFFNEAATITVSITYFTSA